MKNLIQTKHTPEPSVGGSRSNGLARLGGRWSDREFREFENAVAFFGEPDTAATATNRKRSS
jgi:hypothetical protein